LQNPRPLICDVRFLENIMEVVEHVKIFRKGPKA